MALLLSGSLAIGVLNPPVVEPLPLRAEGGVSRGKGAAPRPPACAVAGASSQPRTVAGQPWLRPCPPMPAAAVVSAPVADPIVAAFVVQWDGASRAALKRIGDHLDWVIVEGAFLGRGKPGEITITLDPDLLNDARSRQADVHLMITNFGTTGFDSVLVTNVVSTVAQRADAVKQLAAAVKAHQLHGITLDFELVPAAQHHNVLLFIAELRRALQPLNAVVSAAIPISEEDGYPLREYGMALDFVIPMLYDENAAENEPGPLASARWYAERLDIVLAAVPAGKVIAGLGQYGYHWRSDREEGTTVSVSEAMALSRAAAGGPKFDITTRNPSATWTDASSVKHTVWYLDAVTAWNQMHTTFATGAAGVAYWRLGSEDATLWRVLTRSGVTGTADSLRTLPNDGVSVLSGEGEVLAVEGYAGEGLRTVSVDSGGYIATQTIARSPGGYVVNRGGTHRSRVVLTFDDGPDPLYTAQILDTLKARGAVASFFVLGRQVQRLPDLTKRIADEGHEIGNHSWSHPELAGLSESAIRVELSATARVIEATTGQRPLLFRPPYIGDARPASEDRLRPMAIANDLGLRVVGLEVDPKDWYEKDPQKIVAAAMRGIRRGAGRIILLHDAGGDRTPTLAALGPMIDSLRAAGYEISTVAGLLNANASAGMSDAPAAEAPQRALDVAAMRVVNAFEVVIVAAFLVALVLGLVRLVIIGGLAITQRFRPGYARREGDEEYTPSVTVVIPAYNEGRVIARTVRSVLSQSYPRLEVIAVDDGSSDDTFVQAAGAVDAGSAQAGATSAAHLRVIRQDNGGKASALNHGIAEATGEIIVVIDADTLLAPDAIRELVRPLADARVGAVAGNAKVGNRVNLVTRWQAVEYVTSQNLDRRAFVMLNCITVVPGAIGAWRRSAVEAAGGFRRDTLAEDQDLTLTLLRRGHRVALADRAIALTEAPETFNGLLKQRFRWSFGTLQCAWKHRAAFLRPSAGALGMVGLPNVWLFQLFFPLLAPAADIALLATLARLGVETPALGLHAAFRHAEPVLALYALFLAIDTVTAVLGVALESGERLSQALLVPLQRVAYRQVLYVALVRAMRAALKGWSPGWGKLERTGRVSTAPVPAKAEATVTPLHRAPYGGEERRKAS